jgi:hypothetical protein
MDDRRGAVGDTDDKLRLGGMALRNGLVVHGPGHWAAAVRADDGAIAVASGPKPRLAGGLGRIAGVRGVVRLGEAMAVIPLVKRALPQAQLPFQDATVAVAMGATAAAGMVLRRRTRGIGGEAALAALSLAPSLIALRSGDLAAYHGVEHKAIGAYEQGAGDARDATKEHDRCGSHLMAPLLAANLAGTALGRRASVAAGRRRGPARLDRRRGRGLRVVRAPRGDRAGAGAAPARARAAARPGHARADRGAARGRPRGAGRDPARRSGALTRGAEAGEIR